MLGEQQAASPNFTSYPSPNPNSLLPHTALTPQPIVGSPGTDSHVSPYPYSQGFDGLQDRPAFELDTTAASRSGVISQTIDSTTYEHAGGTLSETTKVSTVVHSSGNFGVVTQHVVNDVILTTKQAENIQSMQCEVCNITCNSEDVLEKHKQGKKHLKNLQKLAISSVIASKMPPPPASATSDGELENKKHKLLQNGASVDTLLYCNICNVVCNNQDVFGKHLAGKKHSAKATIQLANTNGLSNPTSECSPAARPSNSSSQKNPDTDQPARCELCQISCNSNEVLNIHLSGKKHLKKLKESEKIPDHSLTSIASLGTPPTEPMGNLESTLSKVVNSHEGRPMSCELCGINCNTYDVLKNHMSGKKHQRNLEKSKKPIGPNPAPPTEPAAIPRMIGPLQNSAEEEGKVVYADGSKRKAKRVGSDEDLETKKQKILKGGAASDGLRTCTVCNVVCNSPTAFISHLAGQKHAAMAVKHAEAGLTGQQT